MVIKAFCKRHKSYNFIRGENGCILMYICNKKLYVDILQLVTYRYLRYIYIHDLLIN